MEDGNIKCKSADNAAEGGSPVSWPSGSRADFEVDSKQFAKPRTRKIIIIVRW